MRAPTVFVAGALSLAPVGAKAADLVVWWEQGSYSQADEAVVEIVAAFEKKTGQGGRAPRPLRVPAQRAPRSPHRELR
jgi:hypothetical protein